MLHVQVKVTRANGDDLLLVLPVGPVNNWLHSLFSQVDVYLNGTLVTPSTNTYAYRAYMRTQRRTVYDDDGWRPACGLRGRHRRR